MVCVSIICNEKGILNKTFVLKQCAMLQIPHYLLWKKLQSKHFIVPVKEEWNSYVGAQR